MNKAENGCTYTQKVCSCSTLFQLEQSAKRNCKSKSHTLKTDMISCKQGLGGIAIGAHVYSTKAAAIKVVYIVKNLKR